MSRLKQLWNCVKWNVQVIIHYLILSGGGGRFTSTFWYLAVMDWRTGKVTRDPTFVLKSSLWGGWHNPPFFLVVEVGHVFVKPSVCTHVTTQGSSGSLHLQTQHISSCESDGIGDTNIMLGRCYTCTCFKVKSLPTTSLNTEKKHSTSSVVQALGCSTGNPWLLTNSWHQFPVQMSAVITTSVSHVNTHTNEVLLYDEIHTLHVCQLQ